MATVQDLKKARLFESLSDDQLGAVFQLGQEKSFGAGEEIFRHGQKAETFYVLLEGSVSLTIKAEVGIDLMAEMLEKKGTPFGTASLIEPHVYNVTAKCIQDTKALAMDSAGVQDIMRQDPLVGFQVMTELARMYFIRLNSTRAAATNLFKIFKFESDKAQVYDTYGES
jgi:CRP/FNR family cyclic AMP-dependent transcriptional regulator